VFFAPPPTIDRMLFLPPKSRPKKCPSLRDKKAVQRFAIFFQKNLGAIIFFKKLNIKFFYKNKNKKISDKSLQLSFFLPCASRTFAVYMDVTAQNFAPERKRGN
jgi:hypothetical protein